ncbi:MAG: MFS transporter [Alphaproteobacteria bacterium]
MTPFTADSLSLTRRDYASLAAAIGCIVVVGIGLSLSIPLLSFALDAKGASKTTIGLNTAMAGLATIVLAPFVTRLATRYGVRRMITASILLGAATLPAFLLIEPIWAWFPLRFLFAVSLTILFVLSEYWINAVAPENSRGLILGFYASALSLGFAAGPAILTVLGTEGPAPYLAGAALFLLAGLPMMLAGDMAPDITDEPNHGFASFLWVAPAATVAALVFGAAESAGFALLPLYGTAMGFDAAGAAGLISAMAPGNLAFQIPMGLLADRVDKRFVLLFGGLIGTAGMVLITFVPMPQPVLVAVLVTWGGIVAGLYTVGLAHLGSRFRGADLAQANAAFVVMYATGMLLGPPIAGVGMDFWPPHGLPATLALIFAAYFVVVAAQLASEARR